MVAEQPAGLLAGNFLDVSELGLAPGFREPVDPVADLFLRSLGWRGMAQEIERGKQKR